MCMDAVHASRLCRSENAEQILYHFQSQRRDRICVAMVKVHTRHLAGYHGPGCSCCQLGSDSKDCKPNEQPHHP